MARQDIHLGLTIGRAFGRPRARIYNTAFIAGRYPNFTFSLPPLHRLDAPKAMPPARRRLSP